LAQEKWEEEGSCREWERLEDAIYNMTRIHALTLLFAESFTAHLQQSLDIFGRFEDIKPRFVE
jgi:hypothetical protein